jgi:uncharacterized membrane protein (TIGR02234 family)
MPEPRKTFGPVVGLGLASGTLAVVAGTKPWVVAADANGPTPDPLGLVADAGEMPLALALALVMLACWGVLLVSRGVVRRVVAGLALLTALGLTVTVVVAFFTLPDQVTAAQMQTAVPRDDVFGDRISAWYLAAAAGALLSVVSAALAMWWAPGWPEMGRRYDAPGAKGATAASAEEPSSLDLWKSIDEGRDPTVGSG